MLADVKTVFLYGDTRRSVFVELPLGAPWQHLVDTSESLNVLLDASKIGRTILGRHYLT